MSAIRPITHGSGGSPARPDRPWRRLLGFSVVCCAAGVTPSVFAQTDTNTVPHPVGDKLGTNQPASTKLVAPQHEKAFILIPPHGEDWTRHFQMGAIVALNIKATFHESADSQKISGNDPAQGIYDDGYVRTDNTGNSGGYTGYWGYQSASQYDAAAQTLSFHSASQFSAAGDAKGDGNPSYGVDLAYGTDFLYCKPAHVRIGWELGLNFLPISIQDKSTLAATVTQTTYIYDASGLYPKIPDAPYQGGSSGQGPLLPDTTKQPPGTQTLMGGTVTGRRSLDMDLFALRLGPSFFWDITPNLGVAVSGGPVVGCLTGNYDYDETVTINGVGSHNEGSFGATDMVYGGYVNAMVKYHIVDNGRNAYLFLGAQYTPTTAAHISSGGRSAHLDLSGQVYISAGMGWPF